MEIIDLSEETKEDYLTCMEEWSEEMKDGVCRKKCWYDSMRERGLRVKLVRNNAGTVAGMIHYAPIEYSWVEGEDLYFVYCLWVHGHKEGRGDLRKQGVGTTLLRAAEEDVKRLGAKGLVVWGVVFPFFTPAKWFVKQGYRKVERNGISVLLWKTFADDADESPAPPRWIREKKKPELVPGKVTITALVHGWCSGINGMIERAKRVSDEFSDKVVYREIDVSRRETVREWGLSDGLFIDGKNIYQGPPLSYAKIRKIVEKKVGKL